MADRHIGFELVALGHLIKRERDRVTDDIKRQVLGEDNNIKCTDLGIIQYLADHADHEVYQKDIEQHLSLTAPSVSNKLKELDQKGLINRTYSTVDTRLKQVVMTDKAEAIDVQMRNSIGVFEKRILKLLTPSEQDKLLMIIDKIRHEFE